MTKLIRLTVFTFLTTLISQLYGQQVDIGIYNSTQTNQMEIRIRPNFTEDGSRYITNAQFTIKWPVSSGISSITAGSPVSPYNFIPQGNPLVNGDFYYQTFASSGGSSLTWLANAVIVVQTFTFSAPPYPLFEIADDAFVKQQSVNGEFYFEINGVTRTGIIYHPSAQQGPDVTLVLTAMPNILHGPSDFNIVINVTELGNMPTSGTITVKIPKDSRWVLSPSFQTNLTMIGTTPVTNSNWSYSQDGVTHIFTSEMVIPAGNNTRFGFYAHWDGGQSIGIFTVTAQIVSGSGGEKNISNNVDAEKLDYFIY